MKRQGWSSNVFGSEVRLWYLLGTDLKDDQSAIEWVCFQRFSAWRTSGLKLAVMRRRGCKY